jgi:hypothetical protein
MNALLHAHSGLRFLILLLGVVNIVVLGGSLATKKPFAKMHRILGASYAGSLHLQVLLGLSLVAMGDWFPALIGHLTMMILAAVSAQVAMTMNRKRPVPGLQIPLAGVVVSLLFIVGGVMAIGRNLFAMTITGG